MSSVQNLEIWQNCWTPARSDEFVTGKIWLTVDFRSTAAEIQQIVNQINFTINFTTHFGPTAAEIEQIVKLIANIKRNI